MKPFVGLNAEAFAAYSQEKWSSNVHNLARMRVKDALTALAERVQEDAGPDLAGLERVASDEMPTITNQKKVDAQWVVWFRDASARTALASFLEKLKLDQTALLNTAPQDKHAALALVLRQKELWVGLHLGPGASVDRRNLAAKLAKGWERERALELVQALPAGSAVGLGDEYRPGAELSLGALDELGAALADSHASLHLGWGIGNEEAQSLGVGLAERAAAFVRALAPLYRWLAWTRDNDHIEAGKQLQEEKREKRRQAVSYNAGDKVRIVSGLFSGKIGVVQEIDTKAQVKVRVGKMSVVVAGTDLTPVS